MELELLEIEILLYLLNGRSALGAHAESARQKLNKARRQILGGFGQQKQSEPATDETFPLFAEVNGQVLSSGASHDGT